MSEQGLTERVADALDALGLEELTENYRDRQREAEDALVETFDPLPEYLAETPAVAEVNRVNTHDDGGDVVVPVVPVLFDPPGEPPRDRVWDVVGRVLEAVHPAFGDIHVRHYDVQFAYADADEQRAVYRRVTVHPPLVEQFLSTGDLRALRAAVAEGDDGDDGVPPVNFKQFDAESMAASGVYTGGAAVAAAAAASSSGAAAACAGGAGAAGGAAGGC
ncbi:hypothetical protein BRD13_07220 [Halobacteriales archaeon SW_5_70_135]|nr:MAG: hypothetical protein BRD13_07220 [Halobacteriales archaeon SW_5_70_135]